MNMKTTYVGDAEAYDADGCADDDDGIIRC